MPDIQAHDWSITTRFGDFLSTKSNILAQHTTYTAPRVMCAHATRPGEQSISSRIVSVDGDRVTTQSGSVYVLGEPDALWLRWLQENEETLPDRALPNFGLDFEFLEGV